MLYTFQSGTGQTEAWRGWLRLRGSITWKCFHTAESSFLEESWGTGSGARPLTVGSSFLPKFLAQLVKLFHQNHWLKFVCSVRLLCSSGLAQRTPGLRVSHESEIQGTQRPAPNPTVGSAEQPIFNVIIFLVSRDFIWSVY